jgi:hypothetical protein
LALSARSDRSSFASVVDPTTNVPVTSSFLPRLGWGSMERPCQACWVKAWRRVMAPAHLRGRDSCCPLEQTQFELQRNSLK